MTAPSTQRIHTQRVWGLWKAGDSSLEGFLWCPLTPGKQRPGAK